MKRGLVRRIAIKLVVFLLLGAVVNVAVAWGIAWRGDPKGYWRITPQEAQGEIINNLGITRDEEYHWGGFNDGVGISVRSAHAQSRMSEMLGYQQCSTGWPLRTVRGAELFVNGDERYEWAIRIPVEHHPKEYIGYWGHGMGRVLPLRPIWPGFLINTLFYALVLWLLWSTPFAARRLIRKRRGRCVKCGYDLTGTEHEVCPECGGAR